MQVANGNDFAADVSDWQVAAAASGFKFTFPPGALPLRRAVVAAGALFLSITPPCSAAHTQLLAPLQAP
jgi:hypothetical protein